ncbi:hypothetical protein F2Q68_00043400 [Brassica cretica]|uniref:Uncharacterized protein n=1 Tax=Brassica cretica TaxID=69181 RepID=A0A8S9LSC7_BRACR|nr:hypothetical protein F2Q68_00043400 [Brassica cretica]
MPLVKDLIFKDAYVDAARTKILSDGSMNYVVEMYDTALKETISKLKQADKLVRVKDTVLNRRTVNLRRRSIRLQRSKVGYSQRKRHRRRSLWRSSGNWRANPVNTEPSREEPVQESSDRETAEPSATGSSASVEARTGTESDEPPNKKEKKEKRKKKKRTVEERSEPSEDVGGRELVPLDSSNRNVVAQTSVDLDDSPSVPLERKKKSSREGDAPTSVEKSPPAVPSATRSSGSASKGGRIKFPDHVEFKYDGDTPLAYAPT